MFFIFRMSEIKGLDELLNTSLQIQIISHNNAAIFAAELLLLAMPTTLWISGYASEIGVLLVL